MLMPSANAAVETIPRGRVDSLLFRAARARHGHPALVDGQETITYGALASYVAGVATDLASAQVARGDRVAVFLDKTVEAVAAIFGAWTAGAIVVPINEGLKDRQVAHILRHSGASVLVSSERKISRLEPASYEGICLVFHAARQSATWPLPYGDDRGREGEPALILYTSGSTGLPKGIFLSHGNLLAGTRIVTNYLGIGPEERMLGVLPFSFDYGLNQLLTSVAAGATLVLIRSHLPAEICRALADHEITGCAGVPPLWIQLLSDLSPFRSMRFPDLRYITNSGGVFPRALVGQYRAVLPHTRIFLMYGLSEAFRSTYLPPELVESRPDSIGKAIPETEILVVSDDGRLCGPREVGQLVHRGPTVALGYWNDPGSTARVFRPDTLPGGDPSRTVVFSGDLVYRDEEGFLYFVGRRDTMIKTQGYRLSPEEVEETLLSCVLVSEAVVCGRPDPVRGAAVVAHVVPARSRPFDKEALLRYCRREMPGYMQPSEIVVHEALPRTASGKIDRQALR